MPNSFPEPVRLGVVGAGRIAQVAHLPAIMHASSVELIGVYDPSAFLRDGVARLYESTSFPSLHAVLDDPRIEAVVIAAPDRVHASATLECLRAGKHVLVEKPIATSVADAETVVNAMRDTGLVVQVGAMKRHDPGVRSAARATRERIGRIISATFWYRVMGSLRPSTEATYFPRMLVDPAVRSTENAHRANRETYLLATHGAHIFDTLRNFCGTPSSVMARHAQVNLDHVWHGMATLAQSGLAHFEIVVDAHAEWSEGLNIFGERGSVTVRTPFPVTLQASYVEVFDEATGIAERPVFGDTNPYKLQLDAFAHSVRTGAPTAPDAVDGLEAVRLIEATKLSTDAGGSWIKMQ